MVRHATSRSARHSTTAAAVAGIVLAAIAGLPGCNSGPHGSQTATAPPLGNGDRISRSNGRHNVADPNAPFLIRSGDPRLDKRPPILDTNGVPACAPGQLSLFESRARIYGTHHTLRLSIGNHGEACRIGGFPAISLLDARGQVLASVVTEKVSAQTMTASVEQKVAAGNASSSAAQPTDPTSPQAVSPQVLVPYSGTANFELGWTTGPDCPQVNRIAVGAPGTADAPQAPVFINRPLQLCNGLLMVTAVTQGDSDQ
jgi:hypothetical protein